MPEAAEDSRRASHDAILIGIDLHDPEDRTTLTGCVHDVEKIAEALNQSVKDVCIHKLTSIWSPNSQRLTELNENSPTFDNISACLLKVTQKAKQGDYVYIHYSGHSTVVPPSKPHSNWDRGDLALEVLKSPIASGTRQFCGTELAEYLRDMVDKGISVTMVLDCCYSGSTLRGNEDVCYLPYDSEFDDEYLPTSSIAQSLPTAVDEPGQSATLRGPRRAFNAPNWLANPEGYAILTSSDATEKAYDVKFDKSKDSPRHGTLTFFLLDTFDLLGGVGGSMQQLHDRIDVKMKNHRRFRTKKQRPVLFGNNRQLFFGCFRPGCSGDIPLTRIIGNKGTQGRLQLHAGLAHGIVKHDRFALHPLGDQSILPSDYIPVTAEAVNIRGITSDLSIVEGEEHKVDTGWLATATTRFSLRQFPVLLKVSHAHQAEWQNALQKRVSLARFIEAANVSPSRGNWSFKVVQISETACEIHDKLEQTITPLAVFEDLETMKQQVLNQLQHLASFKLVRGLTNTSASNDMLEFQSFFSVLLSKKDGKKVLMESRPGCILSTGNIFDVCFHPGCVVTMTPLDKVYLQIQNKHESPLFVYVFGMSCFDREIEDLMSASREVVPHKGSHYDHKVEATGTFKMKLKFSLEDGHESGEDIVKVFITVQPTSFTTLAMPKLGSLCNNAKPEPVLSAKRGGGEYWAAVTFRVRVVREDCEDLSNRKKSEA